MSNDKINKTATFASGITPATNYTESLPGSSFGAYSYGTIGADNLMGISDEGTKSVMKAKDIKEDIKKEKQKTHSSIDRYLRGLSKTLQSKHIDWDTYSDASKHLFDLMTIFKKMKTTSMRATAVYNTANAFNKLGLKDESSSLRKIAQEIEAGSTPEEAAANAAPEAGATPPPAQEGAAAPGRSPREDTGYSRSRTCRC